MKSSPELRPNWRDAIAVLLIAAFAVLCAVRTWGSQMQSSENASLLAILTDNHGTIEEISLDSIPEVYQKTISKNGYTLHIAFTESAVWVESSDCPTQDCVHTGKISKSGQSIVCLPAKIVIRLESKDRIETNSPSNSPDVWIG